MKWILSISNERSGFKVDTSSGVYEVNVSSFFKILNNVKSYISLDASTLNRNYKMNNIHFN
jgi:hypothetical protein